VKFLEVLSINMQRNMSKTYVVTGFSETCPENYQYHLMAMGFTVGAVFKLVRLAPLGDPWQIEIKGSNLSLRKSELAWISFKEK
jgi:ferrous iron transport protein A